ncbi:MAG: hypothetical protein K8R36_06070, partial [Planctomycetales bacterium]|nr:hypothetical protein [Planctomycetales bacterium]
DLPDGKMKRGGSTGSAMPLCWSHAEYVPLVRSHKDGVCFDRIEPVYQRYARARTGSKIEMWTLAHQPQSIAHGKTLRIITDKAATIHWSFDGWAAKVLETRDAGFACWFADIAVGPDAGRCQHLLHTSVARGLGGERFPSCHPGGSENY